MKTKEIKARFENGRLVPLDRVSFKEGDIIEIEVSIPKKERFSWRGALKHIKSSSVELQHKAKDYW